MPSGAPIPTEVKHKDMNKRLTLIMGSAKKSSHNSPVRGVGMLISPVVLKTLKSVEKISPIPWTTSCDHCIVLQPY